MQFIRSDDTFNKQKYTHKVSTQFIHSFFIPSLFCVLCILVIYIYIFVLLCRCVNIYKYTNLGSMDSHTLLVAKWIQNGKNTHT